MPSESNPNKKSAEETQRELDAAEARQRERTAEDARLREKIDEGIRALEASAGSGADPSAPIPTPPAGRARESFWTRPKIALTATAAALAATFGGMKIGEYRDSKGKENSGKNATTSEARPVQKNQGSGKSDAQQKVDSVDSEDFFKGTGLDEPYLAEARKKAADAFKIKRTVEESKAEFDKKKAEGEAKRKVDQEASEKKLADKEVEIANIKAELKKKMETEEAAKYRPPTTEERIREIARKLEVRRNRKPGEPILPKDEITGEDSDFWNNNAK